MSPEAVTVRTVKLFCRKCGYERDSSEPVSEAGKGRAREEAMQVIHTCPECGSRDWTYDRPARNR
jgi:rubredoxin